MIWFDKSDGVVIFTVTERKEESGGWLKAVNVSWPTRKGEDKKGRKWLY